MAIWKKNKSKQGQQDKNARQPAKPSVPAPVPVRAQAQASPAEPLPCFRIGEGMQVKGELNGRIDVSVAGRVEGKIVLLDRDLTIEQEGRVIAEVHARRVVVRGQIAGDITALDRVEIESSGRVLGDITAPAITLADGSRFTGSINKEPSPRGSALGNATPTPGNAPTGREASVAGARRDRERRGKDRPWSAGRKPRQPSPSL